MISFARGDIGVRPSRTTPTQLSYKLTPVFGILESVWPPNPRCNEHNSIPYNYQTDF